MAPKTTASGRIDEPPMSPSEGAAPKTRPIKGATRLRLMTVWYRNRFTSARSCPWVASVSSVELFPYLAAKYIPPAIISEAISSAEGRDRPTASNEPGSFAFSSSSGAPTAAATGVSTRSRGVTLALKTSRTYRLRLMAEVLTSHSLSFSSHLVAFPDPNEPMMNRTKRNDVGEDWNTPDRE